MQDSDRSVSQEEAEQRFNRYIELVESISGTEGVSVARALIRSMQAVDDYGAYQSAQGKLLFAFPASVLAEAVVSELPRLMIEQPDRAGELLNIIVLADGRSEELVNAFNVKLAEASESDIGSIVSFVRGQEERIRDG